MRLKVVLVSLVFLSPILIVSYFGLSLFAPDSFCLLWKSQGDCEKASSAAVDVNDAVKTAIRSDLEPWRQKNLLVGDGKGAKNIFFVWTSNDSLRKIELCTVFAAAWHNPEFQVRILSWNPVPLPAYLRQLGNVRWEPMNLSQIFSQTPLEPLYKEDRLSLGATRIQNVRHLANMVRYAVLFKRGGIYLDTDMIVMRSLAQVHNVIAWNHKWNKVIVKGSHTALNGAFLSFERGHPYLWLVMWNTVKIFHPRKGPALFGSKMLTTVYPVFQELRRMSFPDWPPLGLMAHDLVHPLMEYDVDLFFKPLGKSPKMEKLVKNAHMVHIWNHALFMRFRNKVKFRPKSMFVKLIADNHCKPVVPTLLED